MVAKQVIESGVAMAGIATALVVNPGLPKAWRAGKDTTAALPPITWKNKVLASLANMAVVKFQMPRLSRGRVLSPGVSPLWAFMVQQAITVKQTRQYRRWMENRTAT